MTAETATAADIDDNLKRKRFRVSLKKIVDSEQPLRDARHAGQFSAVRCSLATFVFAHERKAYFDGEFLPLDEAIASKAIFVIGSG